MSSLPQLPDPDRFVSQATSLTLGLRTGSGKLRIGQRRENWRHHSTQPVGLRAGRHGNRWRRRWRESLPGVRPFISVRRAFPAPGLGSGPYGVAGLLLGTDARVEDEPVGGGHVLVVSEVKQVMNSRGVVSRGQEGEDEGSRPSACWFWPWAGPVFGLT